MNWCRHVRKIRRLLPIWLRCVVALYIPRRRRAKLTLFVPACSSAVLHGCRTVAGKRLSRPGVLLRSAPCELCTLSCKVCIRSPVSSLHVLCVLAYKLSMRSVRSPARSVYALLQGLSTLFYKLSAYSSAYSCKLSLRFPTRSPTSSLASSYADSLIGSRAGLLISSYAGPSNALLYRPSRRSSRRLLHRLSTRSTISFKRPR